MNPAEIHDIFETIAPNYDRFNRWASLGLDRLWRRRAAELARPARSVLDLCSGSGELALECASFAEEVVGVDFSKNMLRLAEEKLARRDGRLTSVGADGRPRVRFLHADARSLPFPDRRFEAVVSAFALRNIHPGLLRCFREIHRVLDVNGKAVLLDFGRPRFFPLRMGHELYLTAILPWIGFLTTGRWHPFVYLRRSIQSFLPPAMVVEALVEAGFHRASFQPLHGGIVGVYLAEKAL